MKYRAAVFDLDGTILNTLDDLADATNHALGECGYPLRTTDEVRAFVGNGIRLLIERAVPRGCSEAEIERVHSAFTAYYSVHCADKTKPYDGITDTLAALRVSGIKLAVVSNKADYAVRSLCADYFPGVFDIAVGEREGIRKKPSPDTVFAVMRSLGAAPLETVYIGDSDVDVETAKNAGTAFIGAAWGFRGRDFLLLHGASAVAQQVRSLADMIL